MLLNRPLAAKSKPIEEKPVALAANKLDVRVMKKPAGKSAGKIIGSDATAVPELVRLLHEEAKVI